MNKQNAIRHSISKIKKFLNNPIYDIEEVQKVAITFTSIPMPMFHSIHYCHECIHDDFGYCGLRTSKIPDDVIAINYCFPSMLKVLEYMLAKELMIKQDKSINN